MMERPIPTEEKLRLKQELFTSLNNDYELTKRRCEYLARWLIQVSGEMMMLRTDLRIETQETPEGQLKLLDVDR